jgi:hypothetical protein
MKLQGNFQPDIPSKAVSTLLEILDSQNRYANPYRARQQFQPFLRFNLYALIRTAQALGGFNPS